MRDDTVVGVIAVQSYSAGHTFQRARPGTADLRGATTSAAAWRASRRRTGWCRRHAELEQRVERAHARTGRGQRASCVAQIGERMRAERKLTHQAQPRCADRPAQPRCSCWNGWTRRSTRAHGAIRRPASRCCSSTSTASSWSTTASATRSATSCWSKPAAASSAACAATTWSRASAATNSRSSPKGMDGAGHGRGTRPRACSTALGAPLWVAGRELFPSRPASASRCGIRATAAARSCCATPTPRCTAPRRDGRDRSAMFDETMRARRDAHARPGSRPAPRDQRRRASCRITSRSCAWPTASVVGHEALLRWRHEQLGLLAPGEFIGRGRGQRPDRAGRLAAVRARDR